MGILSDAGDFLEEGARKFSEDVELGQRAIEEKPGGSIISGIAEAGKTLTEVSVSGISGGLKGAEALTAGGEQLSESFERSTGNIRSGVENLNPFSGVPGEVDRAKKDIEERVKDVVSDVEGTSESDIVGEETIEEEIAGKEFSVDVPEVDLSPIKESLKSQEVAISKSLTLQDLLMNKQRLSSNRLRNRIKELEEGISEDGGGGMSGTTLALAGLGIGGLILMRGED